MKKLQCENCSCAKKGERLYDYNEKTLCSLCLGEAIVAKGEQLYVYNARILCPLYSADAIVERGLINASYIGVVGDYEKK